MTFAYILNNYVDNRSTLVVVMPNNVQGCVSVELFYLFAILLMSSSTFISNDIN